MNIGQNLKNLRLSLGKTQNEIAEMGGFNQGIYANWETNRFVPGAESLMKLADCFGCSVDYLLGRENEESIIVINEDKKYTAEESNLIDLYRKLSSKKKDVVIEFIKFQLS